MPITINGSGSYSTWALAIAASTNGDILDGGGATYNEVISLTVDGVTVQNFILDGQARNALDPGGYNPSALPAGNNNPQNGSYATSCGDGTQQATDHSWGGLLDIRGNNQTVRFAQITRSRGSGIRVDNGTNGGTRQSDILIQDIEIDNSLHAGVRAFHTDGITLERVNVHENARFFPWSRGASTLNWPVIVATRFCTDIQVLDSYIHENWGEGFSARDSDNGLVERCIFVDNYAATGIYYLYMRNFIIRNNFIYGSTDDTYHRYTGTISACRSIAGLIFNHESGLVLFDGRPNSDALVEGNIFFGTQPGIHFWSSENEPIVMDEALFRNNLFLSPEGGGAHVGDLGSMYATNYTNVRFQGNAFSFASTMIDLPVSSNDIWQNNAWEVAPGATWQTVSDVIGLLGLANPLTALGPNDLPVNADYMPVVGSILIDAQTTSVAAPDRNGTARNANGTADIGAFEFVTTIVEDPTIDVVDQTNIVGDVVSYTPTFTNPNSAVLQFTATSLPAGLTINSTTGEVTGTLSVVSTGLFQVCVNEVGGTPVCDTANWIVRTVIEEPCTLQIISAAATPVSGTTPHTINFSVTTINTNVLLIAYQWTIGVGTQLFTQNGTHTFTADGVYPINVTVTALGPDSEQCSDSFDLPAITVGVAEKRYRLVNPDCGCKGGPVPQSGWYVDSNAPVNGNGTQSNPWKEFEDIDYGLIDASIYKEVFAVGGTYRTQLRPEGSVEKITATGIVEHIGPRPSQLPESGMSSTILYSNNGFNAIDLVDAQDIVIDGGQWQGWRVSKWQSDGIRYDPTTQNVTIRNLEVYDNGYVTTRSEWDNPRNVCSNPLVVYAGPAPRSFTGGAGFRVDGVGNTIDRCIIHDNGQDAIQSQDQCVLSNLTITNTWGYNARKNTQPAGSGGPLGTEESFNYPTHTDWLQVYNGQVSGITVDKCVIGPGFSNGIILGDVTSNVDNVIVADSILYNCADNGILGNAANDNWIISNVAVVGKETKNNHIQAGAGSNGVGLNNVIVSGQSAYGCTLINFDGVTGVTIMGSTADNAVVLGTGAGAFIQQPVSFTSDGADLFDPYFILDANVNGGSPSGTVGGIIGATLSLSGFNSEGRISVT